MPRKKSPSNDNAVPAQAGQPDASGPVSPRAAIFSDYVQRDKVAGDKIEKQYNADGGIFTGGVTASLLAGRDQYIYYGEMMRVEWPKESQEEYLARVLQEFNNQIHQRSAGDTKAKARTSRFVEPILSKRWSTKGKSGQFETRTARGTWQELVRFNSFFGVLVGDIQDGKSLLLMKIARDLAERARKKNSLDFPIYIPFNLELFSQNYRLLEMAAIASHQETEELRTAWEQKTRRIALLIDNVDQIPPGEKRRAFVDEVIQLHDNLGDTHSMLIACRPSINNDSLKEKLAQELGSQTDYAEWVVLPLAKEAIIELLTRYGASSWLQRRIFEDKSLALLVSSPGALEALVKATQGQQLTSLPQNPAEVYRLFIDRFLAGEQPTKYHYARVKQPLLSQLAFTMLKTGQSRLFVNDELCKVIATKLDALARDFARSRRVMPDDWNAVDILEELSNSPIVSRDAAKVEYFEFSNQIYRDFYAAIYLQQLGDKWQEVGDIIKQSNLDIWLNTLILLSGLPPNQSSNDLLNYVLSPEPRVAADLWLEKGTAGISRVPDCVAREYSFHRPFIPDRSDQSFHPASEYFRGIARDAEPRIALQIVNGMMQLGTNAIDPLLDAIESKSTIVTASAIHALFHMGEFVAMGVAQATPLFNVKDNGFTFENLGTCNATLGDLVLVQVPRTFRAQLSAAFANVDFDPFNVRSNFELWHTPVAQFAIDYFRRANAVDWIGLAGACNAVARCAGLIVAKALSRSGLNPIIEELTQCAISYDRLALLIASDLQLPEQISTPTNAPQWLIDNADQIYKELRFLFSRTNRSRMLEQLNRGDGEGKNLSSVHVSQAVRGIVSGTLIGVVIDEVLAKSSDEADLPNLTQIGYSQAVRNVAGGEIQGIHVKRVMSDKFLAAEVLSLTGSLAVENCANSTILGIRIDEVGRWDGIRAHLSLSVNNLSASKIVGIRVTPPKEALTVKEGANK